MARRSNRPALYELSKTRLGPPGHVPDPAGAPDPESEPIPESNWFTPGAGIRVPVGFLVLGAIVLVVSIVGSWWIGYGQGVSRTESLMAASPTGLPVDPLLQPRASKPLPAQTAVASESDQAAPTPGLDIARPWHFVLAETSQEGAGRLAAFCRSQGLEVLVIPRHNTGLARIIALPGLTTSSRQATEVRVQEQKIAALGRQWKKNGGRTDFSDRYMDRIGP